MSYESINLASKLKLFDELWSPRVIAELNDYQFKLARLKGDFVWHHHPDTDEAFLVIRGRMTIDFREGSVDLEEGELYVVPQGVEHKPRAEDECHVLVIEPRGVVNTGANTTSDADDLTAENDIWI